MKRKQKKYSVDDVYSIFRTIPKEEQTSNRLRLVACALSRLVWPLMDSRSQFAVEVAEQFAKGEATRRQFMLGIEMADTVVREREAVSFERELTDEEEALEQAAWAAWGLLQTKTPWKPLSVALRVVASAMLFQGKTEPETYGAICRVLRESLAVLVACS